MDGGDDPAFDYVIQAGTGVAAMTGDLRRSADTARLFGGRQLHRAGRGAGPGGPDRVRPRRAGRGVAARCGDVAVELPRLGLAQRRDRAAAASERRALVLRSRSCSRRPTAISHCSSPTTRSGGCSRPRQAYPASRRWPSARRSARRCSPSSPRRWPPTPRRAGRPGYVRSAFRPPRCVHCPTPSRRPRRSS